MQDLLELFFVILKELMFAHLEVLGSIILVTGAWYDIPLFRSVYVYPYNMSKYLLTNKKYSTYNIAELIW